MAKQKRQDEGSVATLDAPEAPFTQVSDPPVELDAAPNAEWDALCDRQAAKVEINKPRVTRRTDPGCIGLPVTFCMDDGTIVPATLQARPRTDPTSWDIRYSVGGALSDRIKGGVRFSPTAKPGCWSFVPGFEIK